VDGGYNLLAVRYARISIQHNNVPNAEVDWQRGDGAGAGTVWDDRFIILLRLATLPLEVYSAPAGTAAAWRDLWFGEMSGLNHLIPTHD